MENEIATIYCDPNAYIMREKVESKPKVDLNHIEKVVYPVSYGDFSQHYKKNEFKNPNPPQSSSNKKSNQGIDINKLLPLLTGKGNISSLMPNILNNLGINQDVLKMFNNFSLNKNIGAKSDN